MAIFYVIFMVGSPFRTAVDPTLSVTHPFQNRHQRRADEFIPAIAE